MMDLKTLTDAQLVAAAAAHVAREKESTIEVVKHFQEIFERRLYLKYGYSSIFIMAVKMYGYCNASAQLRVNAMRLVRDVPAVEEKIQSGQLCMTAAAQIQSFLFSQQRADKPYSPEQKTELVETCLNKSTDELRDELVKRDPEREKGESVRKTRRGRVRVSHSMSAETEAKMKRIKMLWSHVDPNMAREQIIDRMCELTLDAIDPVRKAKRAEERKRKSAANARDGGPMKSRADVEFAARSATGHDAVVDKKRGSERVNDDVRGDDSKKRTRYVRADDRHQLALENIDGGCEFVSEISGERCGSQFQLQRDHVIEFARGGSNEAKNLRMYCAQHNRARQASFVKAPCARYA